MLLPLRALSHPLKPRSALSTRAKNVSPPLPMADGGFARRTG